ncbi:unnamed protein product [Arabis nemorensis]|uniref:J domain-containing protein n=1 Tax=Arabis nemorensis TaxID=586526 RepID=A0A565B4L6_9BRAS|nr:unnamed protein product [Arabis nemorensis]
MIKLNYRKLALKWHPDKNNGDTVATSKFQEINEAYNGNKVFAVLMDPALRFEYDLTGIYEIHKYTLRILRNDTQLQWTWHQSLLVTMKSSVRLQKTQLIKERQGNHRDYNECPKPTTRRGWDFNDPLLKDPSELACPRISGAYRSVVPVHRHPRPTTRLNKRINKKSTITKTLTLKRIGEEDVSRRLNELKSTNTHPIAEPEPRQHRGRYTSLDPTTKPDQANPPSPNEALTIETTKRRAEQRLIPHRSPGPPSPHRDATCSLFTQTTVPVFTPLQIHIETIHEGKDGSKEDWNPREEAIPATREPPTRRKLPATKLQNSNLRFHHRRKALISMAPALVTA